MASRSGWLVVLIVVVLLKLCGAQGGVGGARTGAAPVLAPCIRKDHPGYEWSCKGLLGLWGFEGLYSGDEVVPLGLRREPVSTIGPICSGWALVARITLVALRAWLALWTLRALRAFNGLHSGDALLNPVQFFCGDWGVTVRTGGPCFRFKSQCSLSFLCSREHIFPRERAVTWESCHSPEPPSSSPLVPAG